MEPMSEAVYRYWAAFDDHLQTLPRTRDDERQRDALISATRSNFRADAVPSIDPVQHANTAYRFRFVLGPTLSQEDIEESRRRLMLDAADLLASGISPEHLGLRDWGGPLG